MYHCMHTGVIVAKTSARGWGKEGVMQLPCLRPALAAAAVQYSSICRQSAEWWRKKRRRRMRMASGERATVVMASGMHAWGGS